MLDHANFHADRCHRRRDICNGQKDRKIERITADFISNKTHRPTSVAFVYNIVFSINSYNK